MREVIFNKIVETSSEIPSVFLRVHQDHFWTASEWDILVPDLSAEAFARKLIRKLQRFTPVFEYSSRLACKTTIFDFNHDPEDRLTLDIRGPIIKNNKKFLSINHLVLSNRTGVYFLNQDSEKHLLIERNRADGRETSLKHRDILLTPDWTSESFKSSLGAITQIAGPAPKLKREGALNKSTVRVAMRRLPRKDRELYLVKSTAKLRLLNKCYLLDPNNRLPMNFSFHGPDGVGKSALIKAMTDSDGIDARALRFFESKNLTSSLLPDASRRFSAVPKLIPLRILKFLLVRKLGLEIPKPYLRFWDRSLYDYADKQARADLILSSRWVKLFQNLQSFISKPILLVASVESIVARKPELSEAQIRRIYANFGLGNSVVIDEMPKGWYCLDCEPDQSEVRRNALKLVSEIQVKAIHS